MALLEAAARPTHFDIALGDEVEADGDYFPDDWQTLVREDETLLGNDAGEERLAVLLGQSPLAATMDLKRVADAAPTQVLGVGIGVIACCPKEAIETAVMVVRDAHGYGCGLFFFHAGTLAAGSVLIALLRFIRMVLMFIGKQLAREGNDTVASIAKCLLCYVGCFKRFTY